MRLTVLGCSGSLPGPDSPASGYLVEADGARLIVDLGNGVLGPLQQRIGFSALADIEGVVLTHLHPDHCMDLCGLYVALHYGLRAGRTIPVHGPEGTARRMAKAYGREPEPGLSGAFDFVTHTEGPVRVGPFTVRTARVAHPVPAYAVRVEHEGRALVYSGDTGPTTALSELARGADLLLCEAAFDDGVDHPPGIHLTGREAGEHAASAGVGRLVVTHVPPWGDKAGAAAAAREVFGGPVECAEPGATWKV
ncbi:ribonuclease BN (tRNA processing enzyme) [Haloactinopolyspora alba]|uniref:Ribonuclease BN (tRNA processing enzyme) n=1 Tax=Haloactinopolyspora alba TaxID=648780 RepID=A0A2P8DJ00_9ACTN|nr:MBL fold metallo-hydrolase [Haloactinopolyspora alba]PSK97206.1 ribonuclease BN (tRNA processing enzyme) [Haloactinopolyspora alba]